LTQNKSKIFFGTILIVIGVLGLVTYKISFFMLGYPMWSMGHMMDKWEYAELEELSGIVEKVDLMEIELADGEVEIELHGPLWFWQKIELKEGDEVRAKGVFVWMMEPGEGWHQEFVPFELTVNGKVYGVAETRMPVWTQG